MNKSIISLAAVAFLLMGCVVNPRAFNPLRGSGVVKTETRSVGRFNKVTLNLAGKLYIDRTGVESLEISADDNILPLIRSDVRFGTLTIDANRATSLTRISDLIYRVSAKDLDALEVNGAAEVFVNDLDSESLDVTINGAAKVIASGKAERQIVSINGAGDYNARNLESRTVTVKHAGIGKAVVHARDTLDVLIEGAGIVEYIGDPAVSKTINGIGTVRQIGPETDTALKTADATGKQVVTNIADFTLPSGYREDYAVSLGGVTVIGYRGATDRSHIVLVQGPKDLQVDQDVIRESLDSANSANPSYDRNTHLTVIEKRAVAVRDQQATAIFSDGVSGNGQTYRELAVAFRGKAGPALLVMDEPTSNWNQAAADAFIASIK